VSRNIPVALKERFTQNATTATRIVKIGPFPDGSYTGLAELDRDIDYDDGTGVLTYLSLPGGQQSAQVATADLGVDNSEMSSLNTTHESGLSYADILRGKLDGTPLVVYVIDYLHPEDGHFILGGGTFGELRKLGRGLLELEQFSLSSNLKQTVGQVAMVTCPAIFGSQHYGTGGGVVEEKYPCEYDISAEWVALEITAPDVDDPDLIIATDLLQADDYFAPGMIDVLSGANIGVEIEVLAYASGIVRLAHGAPEPFAIGDTARIRRRCTKRHEGHNSCQTFHGADWVNHFRGFPHMQSGEATNNTVPGASLPGDLGGGGESIGETSTA
jgi:uncharacterized phage protein (TIGR02218 family)